jgi:allophanate hydrolase
MPETLPLVAPRLFKLAVVGAHLSGMALNSQLTERGATLVRSCKTAPVYRLYALPGTIPPKPGLLRLADQTGSAIELEIWEMSAAAFADFVSAIPSPLGIGAILLEDKSYVQGFVCESFALSAAPDISQFGGWRSYVASTSKA